MCLYSVKEIKNRRKRLYKIFRRAPRGKLITLHAECPIVEDTTTWQKPPKKRQFYRNLEARNMKYHGGVVYSPKHKHKFSAFLHFDDAHLHLYPNRELWEIEINQSENLTVGLFCGLPSAIFDTFRLVRKVTPQHG